MRGKGASFVGLEGARNKAPCLDQAKGREKNREGKKNNLREGVRCSERE